MRLSVSVKFGLGRTSRVTTQHHKHLRTMSIYLYYPTAIRCFGIRADASYFLISIYVI